MKKFDFLIFVGRFQPMHVGHETVIEKALEQSEKVIVLVGSTNVARNIRNPFTYSERRQMILERFPERVIVEPIEDYPYDETKWVMHVQHTIKTAILDNFPGNSSNVTLHGFNDMNIGLIGFNKDSTSYYLKLFPGYESVAVDPIICGDAVLSATNIRQLIFSGGMDFINETELSDGVRSFIQKFSKTPEYAALCEEHKFIISYKDAWKSAPYAPTFVTVDAVVIQSGHVLVIRRGCFPGKGLMALPGGFIDQDETTFDSCIRELREETKLKVPEPVIRGSMETSKVFDHPQRSLRGRTITHAFLFRLNDRTYLPDVRGSDDAARAFWLPLSEVIERQNEFYEDHCHIIRNMLGL